MQILELIIPLFIMIIVGYALKRTGFFSKGFSNELNKLVYYIALPAMLFNISRKTIFELSDIDIVIGYTIIVLLVAGIATTISLKLNKKQRGAFIQASYRGNLGYLGLPIALTALGEASSGAVTILVGTATVVHTVLAIIVLNIFNPGEAKLSISKILKNPLIIAIILGVAWSYTNIGLISIFSETLELVSRISLPLILLVVGMSLSFSSIKKFINLNILTGVIKLIIAPVIGYLIMAYVFKAEGINLLATVIMTAMPTAIVTQTFVKKFKGDSDYTASVVSFNTLVSMITIPIIITILTSFL